MSWSFAPYEPGSFSVVYADCPWSFKTWSAKGEGRSASRHYATMTLGEIKALPVEELCRPDAALFFWVIGSMLPQALDVLGCWGFDFKTVGFIWDKGKMGLGYHTRAEAEQCWIATRGKGYIRQSKAVRQMVRCPSAEHSRKPAEVRQRIDQLVGAVPKIELFARGTPPPGWAFWGKEANR